MVWHMANTQRTVSDVVRIAIAARQIRQADVAEALGIAESTFSLKLSGRSRWTLDELDALANFLGVQVADIVVDPAHAVAPMMAGGVLTNRKLFLAA